jgi:hypothetical protein
VSTRTRWAIVAAGLAIVVGLVTLYVFNASLTADRSPKTWVVQPDGALVLSSDRVEPDDRYECIGTGGVTGTPERMDRVLGPGGISVDTAPDGTVTIVCPPGPPANS